MSGLCALDLGLAGLAGDPGSPVHRLDPRAKVVGLLGVTLVAVSTPLLAWPAWVACGVALAAVAAVARVPAREVWRRARLVLPLVLLVAAFAPLLGGRGWQVAVAVAAKATIGTVSAVLLNATTPFPAVLRALEALRVPRTLVLIGGLTYRYLFVVVGEVRRLRAALVARAYRPRTALQAGPVGRAASALFLRTHARGERIHLAMLARGFDGSLPRLDALRFGAAELAFTAALATLVPVRILAEVAA